MRTESELPGYSPPRGSGTRSPARPLIAEAEGNSGKSAIARRCQTEGCHTDVIHKGSQYLIFLNQCAFVGLESLFVKTKDLQC